MLVIYNESKSAWSKASVSDRMSKLITTRELKDGKTKYIDIFCSNDINLDTLSDFTETNTPVTLYEGETLINFQKKNLKPLIVPARKDNTSDILLVTVSLHGKILRSITNTKAAVLNYLFANGELTMTVSVRDFNDERKFEFRLHDSSLVSDTIYTFERTENGYTVNVEVEQADAAVESPAFKINQFRPLRPTNLIFVAEADRATFLKVQRNPDRHEICYFANTDELNTKGNEYYKSGYKAATLFVNGISVDNKSTAFTTVRNRFRIMNILLNNGKTNIMR